MLDVREIMIAAFLIMLSVAFGQTCEDPKTPESMQVAWISPASKTVGMNGWIEAVRVADLRAWIRDNGKDKVRLLGGSEWSALAADAGQLSDHTRSPSSM